MKTLPKFYSIEDLKRDYERTSQGHWFDKDTMRFFKTRLTSNFKMLSETSYAFVTTEKNPSGERAASIRIATIESNTEKFCGYNIKINTFGDFHSLSLKNAIKIMNNLNGEPK